MSVESEAHVELRERVDLAEACRATAVTVDAARIREVLSECDELRARVDNLMKAQAERDACRRRVLVEESDVEGITLERALEVAKARGWAARGPGWPSWLEINYGSSALSVPKRSGVADNVASIGRKLAE